MISNIKGMPMKKILKSFLLSTVLVGNFSMVFGIDWTALEEKYPKHFVGFSQTNFEKINKHRE